MALVAVLWIVAALSIVVTGISQTSRQEIKLAQLARQSVEAQATGQAAIFRVLQQLALQPVKPGRLTRVPTQVSGVTIEVAVTPLNGLIDINRAPAELLKALLEIAAGLGPADAVKLAQAIVDYRTPPNASPNHRGYEASEDLLLIPGMPFDVYANISALITTDSRGGGRVNPLAASWDVLNVLSGGNSELATKIAAERDAGLEGIDTVTTLNGAFVENNATARRYRLEARVPLADGGLFYSARVVDFVSSSREGLPWLTFRVENRLAPAAGTNH